MPTHWESLAEPIPGYRLVERLGRGGFGEVWKAEAPGGLAKAIKFVHGEIAGGDGHHAQQELKALERVRGIRHPFILSMERFDIVNGQLLIVMEIADCNLEQRLRECQKQGLAGIGRQELLGYMGEAAEALDLMSGDYDLQHLDIKPQNIFLIGSHVKVADFGLVKDLEGCTASVTGGVTPVYAPPETFDGWVSRNSDQYSLGIVYQELLTGTRPFNGPSARQYMMQHLTAEPDLAPLPPCDRPIIARALSKDPKDRFPTCKEFVEALKEAGRSTYSTSTLEAPAPRRAASSGEEGISTRLAAGAHAGEIKTTVRAKPVLDRSGLKSSTQGTLRPTLVIGVGQTGLATVDRLRLKFESKFGEVTSWPIVKLLAIDVESSLTRAVEREMMDRLLLCRFRKPSQYFQAWDDLKHLSSWLDPNMMFQISSSGSTNGYRALGRLAFFENYRRILSRLRTEVEELMDPARIQSAIHATGQSLRTDEPRACVVASMGGGVGSGMFIDLCYLVRRVLLEAGLSSPDVEGYLMSGCHGVRQGVDLRRVNNFALAQDLLDITQTDASFTVDYEGEGEVHRFTGPPIKSIYFFDADAENVPEPRNDAIEDLMADALVAASCSAVGKQADQTERESRWPRYRSIGVFSLAYPLRELLRHTSARLCHAMVEQWLSPVPRKEGDAIAEASSKLAATCGFNPNDVGESLLAACNSRLAEPVHVLAAKRIGELESLLSSASLKEQPEVFKRGIHSIKALLGADPDEENNDFDEPPPFEVALTSATNDIATEMLAPLVDSLVATLDRPGLRLERARYTWEGYSKYLLRTLDQQQEAVRTEIQKVCRRARQLLERMCAPQSNVSVSMPGSAGRRLEMLEQYVQEKIACRLREQVVQVYLVLRGKLSDWSRDLVRVRQTVERLRDRLAIEGNIKRQGTTGWSSQTLFPGGYLSLEDAVEHLRSRVESVARQDLDAWIQSCTISSIGGLWSACTKDEEFERELPSTIISAAMRWLQEGLAECDVAGAFFDRHRANPGGMLGEIEAFYGWAAPTAPCRAPQAQIDPAPPTESFILAVPKTSNGEHLASAVKEVSKHDVPTVVTDGEDCVFWRVQAHESLARMLPRWLLESKGAYAAARQSRLSPEILPGIKSGS